MRIARWAASMAAGFFVAPVERSFHRLSAPLKRAL